MGKRRSMMRKKKYDDSYNRQTIKPWSDLTHDVLLLVMMKLGVVDFLAFSRVCKSWRSLAVLNRNKFIVLKPPMSIRISTNANTCRLKDSEGREFKITLPHFAGKRKTFVGVTCGYLIFYNAQSKDFWLVNPITRHEFHFPDVPFDEPKSLKYIMAILVFSPSVCGWVFVVFHRLVYRDIWFCIAGKQEWVNVVSPFSMDDLIDFKGKIYAIHSCYGTNKVRLYEMKLYPEPELVLLENNSFPKRYFELPKLVSYGENVYVIDLLDLLSKPQLKIHEIDIDEMKWVSHEKTGKGYAFFLSYDMYMHGVGVTQTWVDTQSLYRRYAVLDNGLFFAKNWYLFHDCLNVNLLHE